MKPYFLAISSLMLLIGVSSCHSGQQTDNAQVQSDISPVIPKVGGTISFIHVKDNQKVKAGDTLLVIDDRDLILRVKQAEILLKQAEANVVLAERNKQLSSIGRGTASDQSGAALAGIAQANENVKGAQVRFEQAKLNLERQTSLLAEKSTPKQTYDNIKADYEAAAAQLRAVQAQVLVLEKQASASAKGITNAQAQTFVADQNVDLAKIAVEQAQAGLESAKLQHSYAFIVAPCSGTVSDKNVQLGQVVSIGQPLMKITSDSQAWVIANFKETQVGTMKVGQLAEITADAYPSKVFRAKVESLSPATGARFAMLPPDNATGNFVKVTQRVPVKIVITEPVSVDTPLLAGMSVEVSVNDK